MSALNRDPKYRHTLRISTAATLTACVLSLLVAAGAQAAMIKKCPSAKSLEAAAGTPLTIRTDKAGTDVFCYYTHPLSATLQDSVNIAAEPIEGTDAAFERAAEAFAKNLRAPFKKLSGIGEEAWEYTEPKTKLNAGGMPTTTVTIVVGKREVTVISNVPARNVLALARKVS
jgi:hypothetical protein